jgi:hypothetical protein
MPVTWTAGPQQAVQPTLRPSSTALLLQPLPILNTKTPTPTFTNTPTNTLTPTKTLEHTQTLTKTKTLTVTPNKTATKLSQISTEAAKTQSAIKTLTALALPPNPSTATETNGATDDTWQKTISDPAFTWTAVVGAEGYYVYWGTSASGTSTDTTPTASYDPAAVADGTYYLRVRTKFAGGISNPDWTTIFTFRYDNTVPNNPSSATETNGATDSTWQNTISNPAFTWSGASDDHSGIVNYDVYWGMNPAGTFVIESPVAAAHDPDAVTSGIFYLRVRTVDNAGNKSDWTTLFTFKYDITAPDNPSSATETNGATNDTWQNTISDPAFTWSGASDAHSGISNYDVYWGDDAGGTSVEESPVSAAHDPAAVTSGTYYLRVRTVDNVENQSAWATLFTFKYDITAPSDPTDLATASAANDSTPDYTWTASTDAHSGMVGYEIYWDADTDSCGAPNQPDETGTSFTSATLPGAGDYRLCVRAKDNVGNTSGWAQDVFTYIP